MAGNLFLLSNIFLCAYSIELGRLINRPHLKHTPHPTNPIPSSHSIVKATHRLGCIYFYLYGSTTLYFQTLNCWVFFWGGGGKFLYYGPLKRSQLSFDFLLEEKQLSNQRVVESTATHQRHPDVLFTRTVHLRYNHAQVYRVSVYH